MREFLEKILFFCTILLLPVQLGKHFWPDFSIVDGLRIDYLSPTIYLTDILVLLLFLFYSSKHISTKMNYSAASSGVSDKRKVLLSFHPRSKLRGIQSKIKKFKIPNLKFQIGAVVFLLIGIYFSRSPLTGLYKLIKIIEFAFFGFYVANRIYKGKDILIITLLLAMGVIGESLLAIAQFFQQSSIGGFLWIFGERIFSGQTPGIANAYIDGRLLLRPYATFPHPNVLAGYLTIAMALIVSSIKYQVSNIAKTFFVVALLVGTGALLLTLSRVAILLWLLVVGYWLLKKFFIFHFSFFILAIMLIIAFTPLSSRFASIGDVDKDSLIQRQELNGAALAMVQQSPFFGIGLNNFLVRLPEFIRAQKPPFLWLQPVHNIYLFIAAETGVIGFLFSLWFIGKTYKRIKNRKSIIHNSQFIILSLVFVLGFFDHYFLTLQQGQLLLSMILGLSWAKNSKQIRK